MAPDPDLYNNAKYRNGFIAGKIILGSDPELNPDPKHWFKEFMLKEIIPYKIKLKSKYGIPET